MHCHDGPRFAASSSPNRALLNSLLRGKAGVGADAGAPESAGLPARTLRWIRGWPTDSSVCLFLDGFAALSIPVVTMLPAVRVAVPHQEIR